MSAKVFQRPLIHLFKTQSVRAFSSHTFNMSAIKPLNTYDYSGPGAPNPIKVRIILEALNLHYENNRLDNPKAESFVKINPNGRVPALEDPNTGITVWESGAILEYLIETYDKEGRLTATDEKSKWALKQYLHFQMSGQGPYYGQAMWYHRIQPENESAKERYIDQVVRVMEVLDNILKDKKYLVADKLTYVDYAFVPWNEAALKSPYLKGPIAEAKEIEKRFPNFWAWHARLIEEEPVKKVYGRA